MIYIHGFTGEDPGIFEQEGEFLPLILIFKKMGGGGLHPLNALFFIFFTFFSKLSGDRGEFQPPGALPPSSSATGLGRYYIGQEGKSHCISLIWLLF